MVALVWVGDFIKGINPHSLLTLSLAWRVIRGLRTNLGLWGTHISLPWHRLLGSNCQCGAPTGRWFWEHLCSLCGQDRLTGLRVDPLHPVTGSFACFVKILWLHHRAWGVAGSLGSELPYCLEWVIAEGSVLTLRNVQILCMIHMPAWVEVMITLG